MSRSRLILLLSVPCLLLAATLAPTQVQEPKKPLAIEDLYLFDHPQTPALSADGKRLVYIRRWVDAATKRERHSLWLVNGEGGKAAALEPGEPDARAPV